MIELGYMAKRVVFRPDWLDVPHVRDVYAVANCVSEDFCDYINFWRHNDFWFFDSPALIRSIANEHNIDLTNTMLVYYRGHDKQFDAELGEWTDYDRDPGIRTAVSPPQAETFFGYDIVTYSMQNAPECSPLSCNGLAKDVCVNEHCLIDTLNYAIDQLENGVFNNSEPGPYRIIGVSAVRWSEVE
jgi:hypothetical protein